MSVKFVFEDSYSGEPVLGFSATRFIFNDDGSFAFIDSENPGVCPCIKFARSCADDSVIENLPWNITDPIDYEAVYQYDDGFGTIYCFYFLEEDPTLIGCSTLELPEPFDGTCEECVNGLYQQLLACDGDYHDLGDPLDLWVAVGEYAVGDVLSVTVTVIEDEIPIEVDVCAYVDAVTSPTPGTIYSGESDVYDNCTHCQTGCPSVTVTLAGIEIIPGDCYQSWNFFEAISDMSIEVNGTYCLPVTAVCGTWSLTVPALGTYTNQTGVEPLCTGGTACEFDLVITFTQTGGGWALSLSIVNITPSPACSFGGTTGIFSGSTAVLADFDPMDPMSTLVLNNSIVDWNDMPLPPPAPSHRYQYLGKNGTATIVPGC